MKQENWIENTEEGRKIYNILYKNLPTIDVGGCVTEEQIWKCVNEIKNLGKQDVSGSLPFLQIIKTLSNAESSYDTEYAKGFNKAIKWSVEIIRQQQQLLIRKKKRQ